MSCSDDGASVNVDAALDAFPLHPAIGQGVKGVVTADADIPAGMELRAALANNDRSGEDGLPVVPRGSA